MLRHAMILAAGNGTRLQPLTNNKPKALVEINGVPLLEVLIKRLITQGITSFTINIHHYPEQILQFLASKNNFGTEITISDESAALLDSGGGIHKASVLFPPKEDILIHNVDVICNINIQNLHKHHIAKRGVVTLAVRKRETQRYYLFDEEQLLCGWKNDNTGEKLLIRKKIKHFNPLAFSGISILSEEFISNLKDEECYPIRDEFLRQAVYKRILAYQHDKDYWMDVGKPEQLAEAELFLQESSHLF